LDFRIRDNQEQFIVQSAASDGPDGQRTEAQARLLALEQVADAAAAEAARYQAEGKLAALAMESLALIEQSLDIIALMDDGGRVVRINHAIKEITGYLPEEIIGRHFSDFVVQEDTESTRSTFSDLLAASHTIKLFENRWRHKDGGVAVLSWSLRWNAQTRCIHATGRDVTERYKARIALQQANERMHSLLERIGDGFCALDLDWRVTYANSKALAILQLAGEKSVGEPIEAVAPGLVASSVFASLERAMEQRKPIYFDAFYQPAKAWLEIRAYPSDEGVAVFFRDITLERDMRKAAVEKEKRLQEFIQMNPAGYLQVNRAAVIVDVNPALCAMSGYRREELIGRPASLLLAESACEAALHTVHGMAQIDGEEAILRHREGNSVHVLVHATVQRDREGKAQSLNAFLTDITQRKAAVERLEELATHDPLTGLPNRTFLNEQLQVMLDTAPRDENNTVMFVGLDRFKEINEALGYDAGDMLLKEMAVRFKNIVRPGDLVARLGSDEFVVVAHCAEGFESAAKIAEKLGAAASLPLRLSNAPIHIGTSIGISMYPHDGETREQLFRCASTALHKAKAIGGSTYCFFTEEMGAEARTRLALASDLQHALERGQFRLHYQPRIDLKTGGVVGVEALLRWEHPELGDIPPVRFIPIAEAKGLIKTIGLWVLQEACRQTKILIDKFDCELSLSVNLSAHQLDPVKLPQQVSEVLSYSGFPPHLLELELTESAIIQDMGASVAVFNQLKEMGIALSIDDFGVGYSSLSYLQHFPIDTLKLDRSFIDQQNNARDGAKFIKALVDLSHTLDMSVVAEGIESEETSRFLQDMACDEGQGYYFSKPLPAEDLEYYLLARNGGRYKLDS
jgi:diguanylate cyclase (GGDEF)-like protein/PAS domain S-box-containing protein